MILWQTWWVWCIAAMALGVVELILPSFLAIGFAIGAACVGLLLLVGGPVEAWLAQAPAALALIFAVLSLAAWLGLRRVLGVRRGQVKTFDYDINED